MVQDLQQRLDRLESMLSPVTAGLLSSSPRGAEHDDELTIIERRVGFAVDRLSELQALEQEQRQQLRELNELSLAQAAQLEEATALVENQQRSISDLSTFVLQIWDGVLMMPIFGVVDTKRSLDIMEKLLNEITVKQCTYVILDITGVEIVDTRTADYFIKLVSAAKLLGASCVVSGIRPAVAQTLVEIGVDLTFITTVANLRDALRECLRNMGRLQVIKKQSTLPDEATP